jgi:acetyl/propionyl-CoA carboxylase alpha subunit
MKYITTIEDRQYLVEIVDEHHILVDDKPFQVDFDSLGDQPVYSLLVDGRSFEAHVYRVEEGWQVLLLGTLYPAIVEDERERRLRSSYGGRVAAHGEFSLRAPMPGLVVAIPVVESQVVKIGDVLVVLESMKMQNELKSPRDGTVARLRVQAGDSVEQKQVLLSVV